MYQFRRSLQLSYRKSIPFLRKQEVTNIPVFDSVAAHIDLVHRNDILGEVIANRIIHAELAIYGLLGSKQIGNLNIQFLSLLQRTGGGAENSKTLITV